MRGNYAKKIFGHRQIYLGRRGDFQIYKLTKNCKTLQKLFCKKADDFELKLNEDLKNEFGQVMDTYGDLYSELMLERYEEGFKMGLRLAFEAFDDPETDFDE